MILTVEKGKTLLVDGPARISLLSGRASALGASAKTGDDIIVRKGKRMPFEALSNSKVELTLGDSASHAEVDGSSIPPSWKQAAREILSTTGHRVVLVIGGVDCGKTSFCTYLANSALSGREKVALIDGDLGQSDIGPPGTASFSLFTEPTVDLFRLRAEDLIFIGATSPSRRVSAVFDALGTLKEEASELAADLVIVNTDGWVEGDGAVGYKVRLVDAVAPDAVVAIQDENELVPILEALTGAKVLVIDSPDDVKKRDRETRKLLRELAYGKHLREAKVRSLSLSWVEIEADSKHKAQKESELTKIDEDEDSKNAEAGLDEGAFGLPQGDLEGILVALEDAEGRVLGIGTVYDVDYRRGAIRINTPVEEAISKIRLGQIRLDGEGHEIGPFSESP